MQRAQEIAAAETTPTPAQWNLAQRIAFRFFFAYFLLYNLPTPGHSSLLGVIPGSMADPACIHKVIEQQLDLTDIVALFDPKLIKMSDDGKNED